MHSDQFFFQFAVKWPVVGCLLDATGRPAAGIKLDGAFRNDSMTVWSGSVRFRMFSVQCAFLMQVRMCEFEVVGL